MYSAVFTKAAEKQLRAIPQKDQIKIIKKIQGLCANPRQKGIKALQGQLSQYYRVRSGDYRVISSIEDKKLVVLVVKIAHRKDVYLLEKN
jgi:mRNA interferase RelE/StbE